MLAFMRLRDRVMAVKESVFGHHGLLILIIKTVTTHFHICIRTSKSLTHAHIIITHSSLFSLTA